MVVVLKVTFVVRGGKFAVCIIVRCCLLCLSLG